MATWSLALESKLDALVEARRAAKTVIAGGHEDFIPQINLIGSSLEDCGVFCWSSDCVSAVMAASNSIPDDTTWSSVLLENPKSGWWWFESPIQDSVRSVLYSIDEDGWLYMVGYIATETGIPVPVTWSSWPPSKTLGEFIRQVRENMKGDLVGLAPDGSRHVIKNWETTPTVTAMAKFFLAGCVWMQQKIASPTTMNLDRKDAKKLSRQKGWHVSPVKVVHLRRTESEPASNDSTSVDWSCRWIVNGHWRNQPYKDGHRLKYILPYVKGPADKPLKAPSQTVYEVSR